MKSLFILGRESKLASAELISLLGSDKFISSNNDIAIFNINSEEVNFKRFGGSIKFAEVVKELKFSEVKDSLSEIMSGSIFELSEKMPSGKLKFGFSIYGIKMSPPAISRAGKQTKMKLKSNNRSSRFIVGDNEQLNAASIKHNKLTSEVGIELILAKVDDVLYVAKTISAQDVDAYAKRDQARPKRDTKVGMLPPKLAQIIINLASGQEYEHANNTTLLDPFCGTGVILQEATLIGYNVIGSDLSERMSGYSKENLIWLKGMYSNLNNNVDISCKDATTDKWPKFDLVASEIYLGKPFSSTPNKDELHVEIEETNKILTNFLANLLDQVSSDNRICLAIPAWNIGNDYATLPVVDQIEDMGYNFIDLENINNKRLFYGRSNQVVVRQLILIRKK